MIKTIAIIILSVTFFGVLFFILVRNALRRKLDILVEEENITVIKKSPKFPLELRMLEASVDRVPDSTLSTPEPTANATFADSASAVSWADSTGAPYEEGFEVTGFTFNNPVDFRIGDVLLFTDSTSVPVDFDEDEVLVRVRVTDAPTGMPNNGGDIGPYSLEVISIAENITTTPTIWRCRLDAPPPLFEFKKHVTLIARTRIKINSPETPPSPFSS